MNAEPMTSHTVSAIKRAELLSTSGAGILGAGVALLAPVSLKSFAIPLLGLGILMHGMGMAIKHRLERAGDSPRWHVMLYWGCWIILLVLGLWIGVRALRS